MNQTPLSRGARSHAERFLPAMVGGLVSLFLLLGKQDTVLSLVNDDAYYYFQIARNVVHGHGVTFDGQTLTNGFHPLYLSILLPIFQWAAGNDVLPIRLALTFLTVCYFATAYAIGGCVRHISGDRAAATAMLVWTLNPLALFFARGGVEAALYTLVASLLSLQYLTRFRDHPSTGRAVVLGALGGLTILARIDGILLVAVIAADTAILWLLERRRPNEIARMTLAALLPCATLLAPWVIWNFRTFGSVIQVSAQAHQFTQQHGSIVRNLYLTLLRAGGHSGPVPLVVGAIAVVVLGWWMLRVLRNLSTQRLWPLAFLAAYLVLFVGLIVGYYHFYRNWYFLAPSMAVVILVCAALLPDDGAAPQPSRSRSRLVFAIWAIMVGCGVAQFRFEFSPAGEEGSKAAVAEDARWVSAHLPEGATIGSFNSGRLGYFLPRRVVNLDGVVNGDAMAALRHRALERYLAAAGIGYVLERPGYAVFYFSAYAESGMKSLTPIQALNVGTMYRFRP